MLKIVPLPCPSQTARCVMKPKVLQETEIAAEVIITRCNSNCNPHAICGKWVDSSFHCTLHAVRRECMLFQSWFHYLLVHLRYEQSGITSGQNISEATRWKLRTEIAAGIIITRCNSNCNPHTICVKWIDSSFQFTLHAARRQCMLWHKIYVLQSWFHYLLFGFTITYDTSNLT